MTALVNDEGHKTAPGIEVFTGEDGYGRFFGKLDPGITKVGRQEILDPHRSNRCNRARKVQSIGYVRLPMRMHCNSDIRPQRLAHICKTFGIFVQVFIRQLPVITAWIVEDRVVKILFRISYAQDVSLHRSEAEGMLFDRSRPFGARC